MSEYEILDLVAGESAQSSNQFTLYLSVLFAYLVTAYFVGGRLTRAQVFLLSGLYIVVNMSQAWGMVLTPLILTQPSLQSNWKASPGAKCSGTKACFPASNRASCCYRRHWRAKAATRP